MSAPILATEVTTFSFDSNAPTNSHNFETGLAPASGNEVAFTTDVNLGGWVFFVRGSGSFFIPDSYDTNASFEIVIDGPNSQAYGIYDVGAGAQTTPTFAFSASDITALDHVSVFADYRFGFPGRVALLTAFLFAAALAIQRLRATRRQASGS